MCRLCCEPEPPERVLRNQQALVWAAMADPEGAFRGFDTSTLARFYESAAGANGEEARASASRVLELFVAYAEKGGRTDGFRLEPRPPLDGIRAINRELKELPAITDVDECRRAIYEGDRLSAITERHGQLGVGMADAAPPLLTVLVRRALAIDLGIAAAFVVLGACAFAACAVIASWQRRTGQG